MLLCHTLFLSPCTEMKDKGRFWGRDVHPHPFHFQIWSLNWPTALLFPALYWKKNKEAMDTETLAFFLVVAIFLTSFSSIFSFPFPCSVSSSLFTLYCSLSFWVRQLNPCTSIIPLWWRVEEGCWGGEHMAWCTLIFPVYTTTCERGGNFPGPEWKALASPIDWDAPGGNSVC